MTVINSAFVTGDFLIILKDFPTKVLAAYDLYYNERNMLPSQLNSELITAKVKSSMCMPQERRGGVK